MRAARTNDVAVMKAAARRRRRSVPDAARSHQRADDRRRAQGYGGLRGEGIRIVVPTPEGAVEAVTLLLDRGMDVDAFNNAGNTALHGAVGRGERGREAARRARRDADLKNKAGFTPLDLALGRAAAAAAAASSARAPRPPAQAQRLTAAESRAAGAVARSHTDAPSTWSRRPAVRWPRPWCVCGRGRRGACGRDRVERRPREPTTVRLLRPPAAGGAVHGARRSALRRKAKSARRSPTSPSPISTATGSTTSSSATRCATSSTWIRQAPRGTFTEQTIAGVAAPAHVEAVDFDGDGDLDLLVAALGFLFPNNNRVGVGDRPRERRAAALHRPHYSPIASRASPTRAPPISTATAISTWRRRLRLRRRRDQLAGEHAAAGSSSSTCCSGCPARINAVPADINGDGRPDIVVADQPGVGGDLGVRQRRPRRLHAADAVGLDQSRFRIELAVDGRSRSRRRPRHPLRQRRRLRVRAAEQPAVAGHAVAREPRAISASSCTAWWTCRARPAPRRPISTATATSTCCS